MNPITEEEVQNVLNYIKVKIIKSNCKKQNDLSSINQDYKGVYLNSIPSTDFILIEQPNISKKIELFESPLAKCEKSDSENILTGYQSGKRSAIIVFNENDSLKCQNPMFFRLKGCGNSTLGFNLQNMAYPEEFKEIRGVQFSNTAFREIYFSKKLQEILGQQKIEVKDILLIYFQQIGNIPNGLWKYSENIDNLTNDYFERPISHYEWIMNERVFSDIDNSMLFDCSQSLSSDLQALLCKLIQDLPDSYIIEISQSHIKNSQLDQLFLDLIKKLQSQNDIIQDVVLIYLRAGFECGKIKRLLDENLISWGYYIDHNPFQPHCNAHPNNFIVLDLENNENHNLLSPLDFDMAYEFSQFISNVQDDPKNFGTQSREQFDNWNGQEKYELERALGGEENMANFQYEEESQSQDQNAEQNPKDALIIEFYHAFKQALRDSCVKYYRQAYDKIIDETAFEKFQYKEKLAELNLLVKTALVITDDQDT
eukprot:403349347